MSEGRHTKRLNVVLDRERERDRKALDVLSKIPDGTLMYVVRTVMLNGLADLDEDGVNALIAQASRDQVGRGRKRGPRPGSRKKAVAQGDEARAMPPAPTPAPPVLTTRSPVSDVHDSDQPIPPPPRAVAVEPAPEPAPVPPPVTPPVPMAAAVVAERPGPVPSPAPVRPSRLANLRGQGVSGPQ